jgi:phenylpyruvate tautomerase PptA (4-oxalocrotonate tautomerase family)
MPVAHFHLVGGTFTADQGRLLLSEASRCYAEVLDSPVERVRAFIVRYDAQDVAVSGAFHASSAPYFTAVVLAGRPVVQRQELMARLTDVVVDVLEVDRRAVRGQVVEVLPENWSIAGVPAARARSEEIAARSPLGDGDVPRGEVGSRDLAEHDSDGADRGTEGAPRTLGQFVNEGA